MSKRYSHLNLIFVAMILLSSCNLANQESSGGSSDSVSQSPIEEMLSYVPKQWIDQHPADLTGPIIYYLDFEAMSRDFNLPDVSSADSRQTKLPLLTGLATQGLPFTPEKINPLAGSSFTNWGWDVADVSQALYIPNSNVSIIKGTFSEKTITDALTNKGYSSTAFGEFTLLANPTGTNWFAVTPSLILIAPSRNELEIVIQQKLNPVASVEEISHLRQLISVSKSPHGLMIVASGDLAAFDNTEASCSRKFDWDFLVVAFRSTDKYTQMDISYSFPSEQDAIANLPIVRKSLTETPSARNPSLTWADLIELNTVTADKNLVIATVSATSETLLSTSINSRDLYGILPARKLDPHCPLDTESS